MIRAIRTFEIEAELRPVLGTMYNLALAYEVAGRFDDARRLVRCVGGEDRRSQYAK